MTFNNVDVEVDDKDVLEQLDELDVEEVFASIKGDVDTGSLKDELSGRGEEREKGFKEAEEFRLTSAEQLAVDVLRDWGKFGVLLKKKEDD